MNKKRVPIIVLFILLGLPVPFSLLSWIGTLISIANIGIVNWSDFSECVQMVAALLTMFLGGTYIVSYVFSLNSTWKKGKITLFTFLPLLHILLFIVSVSVWKFLNTVLID